MNAAHPTMRQELADCLPPGFRQAPAMRAESAHINRLDAQVEAQAAAIASLRAEAVRKDARIDVLSAALRQFAAPPCPAGQFEHTYQHPELGELECHLEWEPAEPECGWPEEITLMAAYLHGRDIAERLTADEIERIEIAAEAHRQEEEA